MVANMRFTPPTPHIAWIYSGNLKDKLDAATFLTTTQELRNLGWKVTLIAAGDPSQTSLRGVEVSHISRPDIYILRQIIFHWRVAKNLYRRIEEIDILLFHELSAFWLLLFLVFLNLSGKKRPLFIMDTRTLPMEPEDKASWRERLRGEFFVQMNGMANSFFDGRTAITIRMAESLHIPPKKLWGVWHSGVQLETFSNAVQSRSLPQLDEPINVIYIGCMHHERNLLTLCKAVTQANTEKHIFTLTIVGDGNARAELENYAREQGRHVHIFPSVPHEEIPVWLSKAHVGALPFPDEEKFRVSSPIKLFEYLAAGLPVLATKIVCHTDVVENDDAAFWAESSDQEGLFKALQQVKENRDRLSQMGKNAVVLAQKWTWQSSAQKLKHALEYGLEESRT
jgi:glycosyltransferase involved in cell wall biosynthesis